MYRIEDVIKLPRKTPNATPNDPDELCARAFELFDQGKSLKQAVIELRASLQKITTLHEEWRDIGGVVLEIGDVAKRELVEIFGDFESAADLVMLARKRCAP